MLRFTSLSTRLITWTLVTALTTFGLFLLVVLYQVNTGFEQQTDKVSKWSEERLAQRLESDAILARARLETLYDDIATRFAASAQRADISNAIQSRNSVAISELLTPALELADVDGALVLDERLRVLAAERLGADIPRADKVLPAHPFFQVLQRILRSESDDTRARRLIERFDKAFAEALAADWKAPIAGIFVEKINDDFGDTIAIIIGYRYLRTKEHKLSEFSRVTQRGIVVQSNGVIISRAGFTIPAAFNPVRGAGPLLDFDGGDLVAKCVDVWSVAEVCALAPSEEPKQLANELIAINEQQTKSLTWWLIVAVTLVLIIFGFSSLLVSRHITLPLREITKVVAEVAEGNWRIVVPGLRRIDEVGDIGRAVVLLAKSVEERDRLRSNLVEQNVFFNAALNNMSQGLCMFNAAQELTVINKRFLDIYGIEADQLPAKATPGQALACCLGADAPPAYLAERTKQHAEIINQGEPVDYLLETAKGRTISVLHRPMAHGGWVETHEDITERKAAEDKIAYLARHDWLTRLPNRVLFQERLERAISDSAQHGGDFAVLCLDLDDFKTVNDKFGHSGGDEFLRQMAERLRVIAGDTNTVARLGGDEFAIIDSSPDQPTSSEAIATRLAEVLKQPFYIFDQSVCSGASIGAAIGSAAIDPDHLLRNADIALYVAKGAGRSVFRLFEPQMELRLQHRQRMERDLAKALTDNQLAVQYQPMINLKTNEISGFEALLRWDHPIRGTISPDEFIPVAEEVGLIEKIGEWVLRAACKEAASWPVPVKVSINISPVQFRSHNLATRVKEVLIDTGLSPDRLELEVTESVILHENAATLATLRALRQLGIKISMDDFGTGYSSLSGLHKFPFDKIKLDRSFVRDALQKPECAAIVRSVAELGKSLGMATTAEGVETREQLENVRRHGFTEAQGFVFSPAVTASQARSMLIKSTVVGRVA